MIALAKKRRGLTLVELLVVVMIISILSSAAVTMLRPSMEGAQAREGARIFTTAMNVARYRAQETGRPRGILIETSDANGNLGANMGMRISYVESPPNYAGDYTDSKMTITNVVDNGDFTATVTVSYSQDDGGRIASQVKLWDRLKLNYRDPAYVIVAVDDEEDLTKFTIWIENRTANSRWPKQGIAMPFQFIRRPRRTIDAPLSLPTGAVIDIACSGVGAGRIFESDPAKFSSSLEDRSIMILFSSSGKPQYIYHPGLAAQEDETETGAPVESRLHSNAGERLFDSVHFLVGRPDQLGSKNLNNVTSKWVSISQQTGMTATYSNKIRSKEDAEDLELDEKYVIQKYQDVAAARYAISSKQTE